MISSCQTPLGLSSAQIMTSHNRKLRRLVCSEIKTQSFFSRFLSSENLPASLNLLRKTLGKVAGFSFVLVTNCCWFSCSCLRLAFPLIELLMGPAPNWRLKNFQATISVSFCRWSFKAKNNEALASVNLVKPFLTSKLTLL